MSLLMYRDRVLSADRRMKQLYNEIDYDGLDKYSKLYLSKDKKVLIGAVGNIPSSTALEGFKNKLVSTLVKDKKGWFKQEWFKEFIETDEVKFVFRTKPTLFVFYSGHFFIMRISELDDILDCQECDLYHPKVVGNGADAANVLLRSGLDIPNQKFYRMVSANSESVSTVFDEFSIDIVKGFKP